MSQAAHARSIRLLAAWGMHNEGGPAGMKLLDTMAQVMRHREKQANDAGCVVRNEQKWYQED